jgi:DNA-binding NarL/FixJ family response regulator
MIVDDHALFRKGIREVIAAQEDMEVIAEAVDGQQAVDLALRIMPDIILMDLNLLPGFDGIEATRAISSRLDSCKIIMLTVSSREDHIFEAIKAGAIGYLIKDVSTNGLLQTLRGVREGEAPLSRVMTAKILESFRTSPWKHEIKPGDNITRRETEILGLLAEGAKDREIAERLDISEHTVKKHVQNILRKLHVKNRTAAAASFMANRKTD